MQTRTDVNPDRARDCYSWVLGVRVELFAETLNALFNRLVLCLRSRIGFSNYVSYDGGSRKRE